MMTHDDNLIAYNAVGFFVRPDRLWGDLRLLCVSAEKLRQSSLLPGSQSSEMEGQNMVVPPQFGRFLMKSCGNQY